jgi:hypothetical protein
MGSQDFFWLCSLCSKNAVMSLGHRLGYGLVVRLTSSFCLAPLAFIEFCSHMRSCEKWCSQLTPLSDTAVSLACTSRTAARQKQFYSAGFSQQKGCKNQSASCSLWRGRHPAVPHTSECHRLMGHQLAWISTSARYLRKHSAWGRHAKVAVENHKHTSVLAAESLQARRYAAHVGRWVRSGLICNIKMPLLTSVWHALHSWARLQFW